MITEVRWLARDTVDVPAGLGWLSAPEAARAAAMHVAKRRDDFLAGRWVAKQAVALALGLPRDGDRALASIAVLADADGAPYAEVGAAAAGLTVSLTHRAGTAVCALAPAGVAVGCDLELVEPRSAAFVRDYLTPAEQAYVAAGDAGERANLVWSAKESALKAMRTGLRRDTRSVEVTVGDAAPAADGWRPLGVRGGTRFSGWWRRLDAFVLTVVTAVPTPPPVRLAG